MAYQEIKIQTAAKAPPAVPGTGLSSPGAYILVIYTGGTLGMVYDKNGQHLIPFDFEQIQEKLPELARFHINITLLSFDVIIDSSNIKPEHWIRLAQIIRDRYTHYDGFVILHGTDTMAYSASALSFLLEDLNKPVIFTGAQLPIGAPRTDARSNFISALEIASAREYGRPLVPEVCIYFGDSLLRGNRAQKVESTHFSAFESPNYPVLAEAGVNINYNRYAIRPYDITASLHAHDQMDSNVAVLTLFPGVSRSIIENILTIPGLRAVVLRTYGAGNAPTDAWFINCLSQAIENDILIYNVSQCNGGMVMQGRYETSKILAQIGVISGKDITTDAAVTKLMYLLANNVSLADVRANLMRPIRGEMSL
ncbi:L-asparaginase [Catalinimonas alkaloidigena]|uniref:asparaginase n=1 Tax=Catalinimonas alkaloidigena TaxID=1075417 RepID=A0A1G8WI36_9BACT|nr:asparaginase [Catalinimonas alkaloidigena]SDJ77806.1 L-asparaginase [Catalinimonas alkaloidigena]